ncbi:hypothetical protein DL93DRAFT_478215 [Clavulina sp. PMI_390]|nr:hypothetical protein DL93DRAFT_478215 [Clavulina sp. PMI_390]
MVIGLLWAKFCAIMPTAHILMRGRRFLMLWRSQERKSILGMSSRCRHRYISMLGRSWSRKSLRGERDFKSHLHLFMAFERHCRPDRNSSRQRLLCAPLLQPASASACFVCFHDYLLRSYFIWVVVAAPVSAIEQSCRFHLVCRFCEPCTSILPSSLIFVRSPCRFCSYALNLAIIITPPPSFTLRLPSSMAIFIRHPCSPTHPPISRPI